MELTKDKLFFCYDMELMKFLNNEGHRYIIKAIHPTTLKMFFVYTKSNNFQAAIDKFNSKQKIKQ